MESIEGTGVYKNIGKSMPEIKVFRVQRFLVSEFYEEKKLGANYFLASIQILTFGQKISFVAKTHNDLKKTLFVRKKRS